MSYGARRCAAQSSRYPSYRGRRSGKAKTGRQARVRRAFWLISSLIKCLARDQRYTIACRSTLTLPTTFRRRLEAGILSCDEDKMSSEVVMSCGTHSVVSIDRPIRLFCCGFLDVGVRPHTSHVHEYSGLPSASPSNGQLQEVCRPYLGSKRRDRSEERRVGKECPV